MRRITVLLLSLLALVGAGALGTVAATGAPTETTAEGKASAGSFVVAGNVKHRLVLSNRVLERLPSRTVDATFRAGPNTETRTYTGPLLLDVLELARPAFDPQIRNDKLRHYISVTATDAYQATIAWGEIDPEFANKEVLLATTEDGRSLEDEGPRLVVPGDKRGGRYVTGVERIHLRRP